MVTIDNRVECQLELEQGFESSCRKAPNSAIGRDAEGPREQAA